jgi:hypothetical protein
MATQNTQSDNQAASQSEDKSENKGKAKANRMDLTAATADRFDLYLRSVQEAEAEVTFFDRVFQDTFGRTPMTLREDFCAAAAVCCEWARSHKERTAVGYDLDPDTLEWCRKYNLPKLHKQEQQRVTLRMEDVRIVTDEKSDIIAAENFSFFFFMTRDELRDYFKVAYQNLPEQGLFVLDMMGGPETWTADQEDVRKVKIPAGSYPGIEYSKGVSPNGLPQYNKGSFKYVWEQHHIDPITHDCTFFIHFRFKDGTEIKKAFEYNWRLWTLPEVREIMIEAGFPKADVYWEGAGEDGEGDGEYVKTHNAECEAAWIAYVVGVKG